ncbi:MAG: hypothetical protein U5R31_04970 [Acidimicrobiia bacterium]|nr:hypothetical protein [Acidimicrobiia bacterium]
MVTIDTNSGFDDPASRGDQLLAALDHVVDDSPAADLVDPERLAVMGWSMAAVRSRRRPTIPPSGPPSRSPWNTTTDWSSVTVPTLLVGCQDDVVAPVAFHSEPFYESLTADLDKAYLEDRRGGDHYCVTESDDTIAVSVVSFLKRFVDGDERYDQFLCPPPADTDISEYRDTCPYG